LYETLVWIDWPAVSGHLTTRLGVDEDALIRGYRATATERGTGHCGSIAGDLAAIVAASGAEIETARLAEIALETAQRAPGGVHLYDDAVPVLRALRSGGARIAIVSNCDYSTRPIIDALGLAREVDAIVLSCEIGSMKPDEPIFRAALARLDAAPEAALFVDDQPAFLDAAKALGIQTVQIARPGPYGEPPQGAPHRVIESLRELL
jgi:HAD superfamily hydrolase (TIGR01509 family)